MKPATQLYRENYDAAFADYPYSNKLFTPDMLRTVWTMWGIPLDETYSKYLEMIRNDQIRLTGVVFGDWLK